MNEKFLKTACVHLVMVFLACVIGFWFAAKVLPSEYVGLKSAILASGYVLILFVSFFWIENRVPFSHVVAYIFGLLSIGGMVGTLSAISHWIDGVIIGTVIMSFGAMYGVTAMFGNVFLAVCFDFFYWVEGRYVPKTSDSSL